MFFNTVYSLPIWQNLKLKNRMIRLFIIGAILYIISYSYLYSGYVKDSQLINNYKHYLFYIIGADLVIFSRLLLAGNKKKQKRKNNRRKHMFPYINRQLTQNVLAPKLSTIPTTAKNKLKKIAKTEKQSDVKSIKLPVYGQNENNKDNESIKIPIYESDNQINDNLDIPIYGN